MINNERAKSLLQQCDIKLNKTSLNLELVNINELG